MKTRTYRNGDFGVTLRPDGTKYRVGEGDPMFPESIDLKITNYCDAGCQFCHETSTRAGQHGRLDWIMSLIESMHPHTELAIGGGNPLSHPELSEILAAAWQCRLIANLTVHQMHVEKMKMGYTLGAVGLSLARTPDWKAYEHLKSHYQVVIHLINRVHHPDVLHQIRDKYPGAKVLILGYKEYGLGAKFAKRQQLFEDMSSWPSVLDKVRVAFDNLAISQLNVRNVVSEKTWERFYMGNDGHFTMYYDAVRGEYAVSSTSERFPVNGQTLESMFRHVRRVAAQKGNDGQD